MKTVAQQVNSYLQEVLGSGGILHSLETASWAGNASLPFYLQDLYTFALIEVVDQICLLMVNRAPTGDTPAVIRKHWEAISKRYPGDVIYVVDGLTSYNRKRLVEQRVPFIVPGNQLYIPMLGLDLREHFKQGKRSGKQVLGAVAQVLVLREILNFKTTAHTAKQLAERLGYSAMTLSRATKELVGQGLAAAEIVGREKRLEFNDHGRELWLKAKPYLRTPIKKRIWIANENLNELIDVADAKTAGESAIAELTMLADPYHQVLAMSASEWPGIKKLMDIAELDHRDSDSTEIQLWRYNPASTTRTRLVDPLSLWLSLDDNNDERIDMAKDDLLEHAWSNYL